MKREIMITVISILAEAGAGFLVFAWYALRTSGDYLIGSQIPGQMSIKDVEEDKPEEVVQAIDQSTGEIYETPSSNVIDLRRSRQA